MKWLLEEKPTLFLSVFDVKLKLADERLWQGIVPQQEESTPNRGRGKKVKTLCL